MNNDITISMVHEPFMGEMDRYKARLFGINKNADGIATLSIDGGIDDETWSMFFGAAYTSLRANIEALVEDDSVKGIVLMLNSPGGAVGGCFETCEYIRQARNIKPIWAFGEHLVASAAYALAASCSKFYATETTEIGSIGVMAQTLDFTEYYKKRGIISRMFRSKNAEKKNLSLDSEEGAEDIQEKLDFYESKFYQAIALGRDVSEETVLAEYGHGKTFVAPVALDKGMIDGITSYEGLIENFTSSLNESEGEDMDLTKMSAEERNSLYTALLENDPSLSAERDGNILATERNRISSLLEIRTDANASIVDAAISDGRSVESVAVEILKSRSFAAPAPAPAADPMSEIKAKAEATQTVQIPAALKGLIDNGDESLIAQAKMAVQKITELTEGGK